MQVRLFVDSSYRPTDNKAACAWILSYEGKYIRQNARLMGMKGSNDTEFQGFRTALRWSRHWLLAEGHKLKQVTLRAYNDNSNCIAAINNPEWPKLSIKGMKEVQALLAEFEGWVALRVSDKASLHIADCDVRAKALVRAK